LKKETIKGLKVIATGGKKIEKALNDKNIQNALKYMPIDNFMFESGDYYISNLWKTGLTYVYRRQRGKGKIRGNENRK